MTRLEVGRIDKAHGVQGDVLVTLLTDRVERVAPGSRLYHDDGELLVEWSKPHQRRFIVNFTEITTREAAHEWRGTVLYADPIEDPDVLWVHDLIDCPVVDPAGNALGSVESVEENPASDLLVMRDGSLIPLTFFVEQLDDEQRTIVVDPPEGLFDPIDAPDTT